MADNVFLNPGVQALFEIVDQIAQLPEDDNLDRTLALIKGSVEGSFTEEAREKFINKQVEYFYQQNAEKNEVIKNAETFRNSMIEIVKEYEGLSEKKQETLFYILNQIADLIQKSADRYRGVEKIIYFQKLNEKATFPTYAHQEDACADLYCPEDVVVPANARGFKVGTGLAGAIPSGWEIQVRPRSGMSMKTPLRISNCVGSIDSSYLGEWCVLFDNLSNQDYQISAGDRIAQVALKPVYYFRAEEVKDVHDVKTTERGDGGFGSSGK